MSLSGVPELSCRPAPSGSHQQFVLAFQQSVSENLPLAALESRAREISFPIALRVPEIPLCPSSIVMLRETHKRSLTPMELHPTCGQHTAVVLITAGSETLHRLLGERGRAEDCHSWCCPLGTGEKKQRRQFGKVS